MTQLEAHCLEKEPLETLGLKPNHINPLELHRSKSNNSEYGRSWQLSWSQFFVLSQRTRYHYTGLEMIWTHMICLRKFEQRRPVASLILINFADQKNWVYHLNKIPIYT